MAPTEKLTTFLWETILVKILKLALLAPNMAHFGLQIWLMAKGLEVTWIMRECDAPPEDPPTNLPPREDIQLHDHCLQLIAPHQPLTGLLA